jgi:hypothetical protein
MDGRVGPVDINLDFVYDHGKVKQKFFKDPSIPDVKYDGWVTRAKVDYPWEKFNFGAVGMYASGADANKTSTAGLPGQSVANPAFSALVTRKVGSYIVPPGSEQSPGGQESIVVYSCFNAVADGGTGIAQEGNYQQVSRGSFGGTWFAKLYGSFKATPWYKLTLQGLYIGDTTKHGNTLGTARKAPYTGTAALRDDGTIGWELDLINEFQIYKNLSWTIGAGYLWAGKALDVWRYYTWTGVPATSQGANFSLKNPWNVTTRLLFTF